MNHRPFATLCPAALLSALLLTTGAGAQQTDEARRAREVEAVAAKAAADAEVRRSTNSPVVTLKFPGGTVADYVKALSGAGSFNIVVRESAQMVPVPPIELTSADADAAVKILSGLAAADRPADIVTVQRAGGGRDDAALPVYVVDRQTSNSAPPLNASRAMSLVENVSDLVESGLKPDDILQAIETAVLLFNDEAKAPEIRFHEPTGLIIARGRGEHIEAIAMVVNGLRGSTWLHRKREEEQAAAASSKLKQEHESLLSRLAALDGETERMNRDRTEAMVRLEATTVELERLRKELDERSRQLDGTQAELRAAHDRIEQERRTAQRAAEEIRKEGNVDRPKQN